MRLISCFVFRGLLKKPYCASKRRQTSFLAFLVILVKFNNQSGTGEHKFAFIIEYLVSFGFRCCGGLIRASVEKFLHWATGYRRLPKPPRCHDIRTVLVLCSRGHLTDGWGGKIGDWLRVDPSLLINRRLLLILRGLLQFDHLIFGNLTEIFQTSFLLQLFQSHFRLWGTLRHSLLRLFTASYDCCSRGWLRLAPSRARRVIWLSSLLVVVSWSIDYTDDRSTTPVMIRFAYRVIRLWLQVFFRSSLCKIKIIILSLITVTWLLCLYYLKL